jgi:heterotetrameric sarcosine oxidase delta subunit
MGFLIDCPDCGPRSYHEFWFGGELRPYDPDAAPDEDYANVWLRENVAGPQVERWFHFAGCRRWLTLERDTRTNEILRLVPNVGGGTSAPRPDSPPEV